MAIQTLKISPWVPDMPSLAPQSSFNVLNVVPRTDQSYGPMPALSSYAIAALAARCQGAYASESPTGAIRMFAGTATDMYSMVSGTPTWSSVSKSAAAYSCASNEYWKFATINSRCIATNITDRIQTFTLDSSTKFADLSTDAPKAKYCAGIKQWLMVANTNDPIGGTAPWRVWWAAIGDPASWPTPGSASAQAVQSDYNDIVGAGGQITGIVGNLGTADGAIFFEHAVWRIMYTGPPGVFSFYPAQGVKGCQAPHSITQLANIVYYLGEDGFYVFDGTTSVPIGANKVNKTFFADVDNNYLFRIVGAVDPVNTLVFWAYPGTGHTQGNPNHLIVYNWVTQGWSIIDTNTEYIFRTLTFGYTLDSLDGTGYSLDSLPYSLDSQQWAGGSVALGGFDSSHVFGYFSGANMAATVEFSEDQYFPGQRSFIRNCRPLVDATSGTPSISFGTREVLTAVQTFNNATAVNSLGWAPQRITGRYLAPKLTLPASSVFTHIEGVEIDADPVGVR